MISSLQREGGYGCNSKSLASDLYWDPAFFASTITVQCGGLKSIWENLEKQSNKCPWDRLGCSRPTQRRFCRHSALALAHISIPLKLGLFASSCCRFLRSAFRGPSCVHRTSTFDLRSLFARPRTVATGHIYVRLIPPCFLPEPHTLPSRLYLLPTFPVAAACVSD